MIKPIGLRSRIPLWAFTLKGRLQLPSRFLSQRYPFSGGLPEGAGHPFFIIGSGRSGTTLLRAMLCGGGEVAIPPESYVLPVVIRKYASMRVMPWEALSSLILSEFEDYPEFVHWGIDIGECYREARALKGEGRNLSNLINIIYSKYAKKMFPDTKRWGDKSIVNTLHLKLIDKVFPSAKYIHMLRDGRDVVSSYMKADLSDSYEHAARLWKLNVRRAVRFGSTLDSSRYITVRYEDLVSHPEESLKALSIFLDINYRESMLDYWKGADGLGDTCLSHHKNIHKPVSTSSIGAWRRDLTEVQARIVYSIIGKELLGLGYPRE